MKDTVLAYDQALSAAFNDITDKQFENAFARLNQLVLQDENRFEAWYLLGIISLEINDEISANNFFENAFKLEPKLKHFGYMDSLIKQQGTYNAVNSLTSRYYEYKISQETDIFLLSYPKCGRTWLRLLLGKTFVNHFNLDTANMLELKKLSNLNEQIPKIEISHDDYPHCKPFDFIESDKHAYEGKKIIFLIRDPRDIVVSYYFQYTKRGDKLLANDETFNGNISQFIRHPIGGIQSIIRFFNIWAENAALPQDFMILRYEDLQQNTFEKLKQTLDFIGLKNISNQTVEDAIKYSSFDNMKQMERKDSLNSTRLSNVNLDDPEAFKVRKGKIGGYKDYLTSEDIVFLDNIINKQLNDLYWYYKSNAYSKQ